MCLETLLVSLADTISPRGKTRHCAKGITQRTRGLLTAGVPGDIPLCIQCSMTLTIHRSASLLRSPRGEISGRWIDRFRARRNPWVGAEMGLENELNPSLMLTRSPWEVTGLPWEVTSSQVVLN